MIFVAGCKSSQFLFDTCLNALISSTNAGKHIQTDLHGRFRSVDSQCGAPQNFRYFTTIFTENHVFREKRIENHQIYGCPPTNLLRMRV